MLNKLLKRYRAYKQNKQEQKEIHQKLEDLTHPLIERILKHERNGH